MSADDANQQMGDAVEQDLSSSEKKRQKVLDDIIVRLGTDDSVFNIYKEKADIGAEIAKQLLAGRKAIGRSSKGFSVDDVDTTNVGVLTQCRGLQTIATLSKLKVNLKPYENLITTVLEDVLDRISDKKGGYIFDATPYLNQERGKEDETDDQKIYVKDYVDTIASVLTAMITVRSMIYEQEDIGDPFDKRLADLSGKTEDVVHECLRRLNVAALTRSGEKDENDVEKKEQFTIDKDRQGKGKVLIKDLYGRDYFEYKGWSFTKCDKDEHKITTPSIYFTYVVTMAYMSVYEELKDPIEVVRDGIRKTKKVSKERLAVLEGDDKYQRDRPFFEKIRKEFEEFTKRCVDAGRYIDMKTRYLNITDMFIGSGLKKVTAADIENSTTNDSPLNTLMVVSVLINSGVDLDYKVFSNQEYGDDSKLDEYYERLQYALQNVEKCYKAFVKENKEYVIDQYILNFNERIPSSLQEQAKLLRNQKISMLSLMPVMIRTYNLISSYLIRYPQKQAITYLSYTMSNRLEKKDGNKMWAWDIDGYNINVNYMYIEALKAFYDYYHYYEEIYSSESQGAIAALEKKYETKLKGKETAFMDKVKELEESLEKEKAKNRAKDPLLAAMDDRITKKFSELFEGELKKVLRGIYKQNMEEDLEEEKIDMAKLLQNTLLSYFDDVVKDQKDYAVTSTPAALEKVSAQFKEELEGLVRRPLNISKGDM